MASMFSGGTSSNMASWLGETIKLSGKCGTALTLGDLLRAAVYKQMLGVTPPQNETLSEPEFSDWGSIPLAMA